MRASMGTRSWWFSGLAAVVLVCAGAVAGWLIATPAAPDSLAPAMPVESVSLTSESFADARPVTVTITTSSGADLLGQADGVVTATGCKAGSTWASGDAPMGIDGQRLIVLSTAMPMWRDLAQGDHGTDVAALQTELHRLGVATSTGGTLTASSWSTITKYLAGQGLPTGDDVIGRAALIWSPAPTVTLGSCPARVGQRVTPGTPVAVAAPQLASLAVDPMPTDLVAGARILTIGTHHAAITGGGAVTTPKDLAGLATEPQIAHALADSQQPQISARLALAEPVTVYSVPAGAVSGAGTDACIATPDGPMSATVVSSTLGRTLITFPGAVPASALVNPDRPASCS